MANKPKLSTSGVVASELKLPRWQLAYLIERGDLPGPTYEVPGRKLFTEQDVVRIREALLAREEAHDVTVENA